MRFIAHYWRIVLFNQPDEDSILQLITKRYFLRERYVLTVQRHLLEDILSCFYFVRYLTSCRILTDVNALPGGVSPIDHLAVCMCVSAMRDSLRCAPLWHTLSSNRAT